MTEPKPQTVYAAPALFINRMSAALTPDTLRLAFLDEGETVHVRSCIAMSRQDGAQLRDLLNKLYTAGAM